MLSKFEIHGVHITVDDNLRKYVTKKIGGLDRYLSKHNRESAHGEVYLKEGKAKNNTRCTCEVNIYVPHETINIQESAHNMYAAIDIAEVKIKQRLQKYKNLHQNGKMHRHLFARLRRRLV